MGALKNRRHEIFACLVFKGLPIHEAYKQAGYKTDNMKPATIRGNASQLRSKQIIASRIQELQERSAIKVEVEQADVLKGLWNAANFDIRTLFDEDGKLKLPKDFDEIAARAVVSIEVEELFDGVGRDREHIGYTRKVRLEPRAKYWEMLGKHLKMFTEKVEHDVTGTLAELIEGSMQRQSPDPKVVSDETRALPSKAEDQPPLEAEPIKTEEQQPIERSPEKN